MTDYIQTHAEFSPCKRFRYALMRRWGDGERAVLFIGLNPSTADAQTDDPTIRKCVGFAKRWGYDGIWMGNMFPFRATDPKALVHTEDCRDGPIGVNWGHLVDMHKRTQLVVAAWGSSGPGIRPLVIGIRTFGCRSFGTTMSGDPKHPLYLPYSLETQPWPPH